MTKRAELQWNSGMPPKAGRYPVKSDGPSPNKGWRYFDGKRFGPLMRDPENATRASMLHRAVTPKYPILWGSPKPAGNSSDTARAVKTLCKALKTDPDIAWSWHCNIAMAAYDEGMNGAAANRAAARFLALLVPGLDMTKHPHFADTQKRGRK